MQAIAQTFARLKETGTPACIPFLTVGDPDLPTSIALVQQLVQSGAHIIELGVPYSDPLADGPVIQRAAARSLAQGTTLTDVFSVASTVRSMGITVPLVLFSYYNPLLQYGLEPCMQALVQAGIDGLIVPDLPMEESAPLRQWAQAYERALIPLVAPTSRQRIATLVQQASGFVYCVSSLGVTGERAFFDPSVRSFIETVRTLANVPVCVGFGISTPEQVQHFAQYADGVIVGSALVRHIESRLDALQDEGQRLQAIHEIGQFLQSLFAEHTEKH